MPDFIDRDPVQVAADVKTTYEQALGKTLFPAQPEQLLLNGAAYREALVRLQIQQAAEQNLVNFATGENLDELGALVGALRLPPAAARVTLQFSRLDSVGLLIPQGFRVAAPGDQIWFETLSNLTIAPGSASGTVEAQATRTGEEFNGFAIGQVNQLVDTVPSRTFTVTNTTVPVGGSTVETDERFRRRIKLAPNQFSVAGSRGAYQFFTLSVDPTIIDVAAINGGPVVVKVYPLVATGTPSADILAAVQARLNDETIRPLTDIVDVLAPTAVAYTIDAQVTLYSDADAAALDDALLIAANAYATGLRQRLGLDIVRSQIINALSLEGVYSVNLISPAADVVLTPGQWANATSVAVAIVGESDG